VLDSSDHWVSESAPLGDGVDAASQQSGRGRGRVLWPAARLRCAARVEFEGGGGGGDSGKGWECECLDSTGGQ
jgi:hypothetical protein